uniref:Reverse transcriptase zinc-binding domain-containing protein n=1 Tax=Homalodisca liturata TaxID=320908 RepID=A0A1B6JEW1_9HEMI
MTQILSGHGCFRAYIYRFKHDNSPECPSCPGVSEDAEHVFFMCPRFSLQRDNLELILNRTLHPETLVEAMLSSKATWDATSTFAMEVLKELRSIERQRYKLRNN